MLEAVAFGSVNFAFTSWAIALLTEPGFVSTEPYTAYLLVLFIFLVAPLIWPIALHLALDWLASVGWILQRYRTSWDDFFRRKEPCWVIVHLKDGRRLGGWFGASSYASLYPRSGHIYIEELWELDEDSRFVREVPRSRGAILRPEGYHFLEAFKENPDGEPRATPTSSEPAGNH